MDLSGFCTKDSSEEGSWMEIMDFDWETPIGAQVLVLGPDSKEAVKIADEEEKIQQKRLADMFAKGVAKKNETDLESSEEKAIFRAVRLTKGWRKIELHGKEYPYSPDNAKWLYGNSPHIRNQVLAYYQNRKNFTKPELLSSPKQSGANSPSTTRVKGE
jgi:hypothetical protein